METYSVLLALYEGNSPVTGGFPSQRPVTRSFGVFFDLHLDKHLSKQSRHRWFESVQIRRQSISGALSGIQESLCIIGKTLQQISFSLNVQLIGFGHLIGRITYEVYEISAWLYTCWPTRMLVMREGSLIFINTQLYFYLDVSSQQFIWFINKYHSS